MNIYQFDYLPTAQLDGRRYAELIEETFGEKPGYFVDVGAADGWTQSNTRGLVFLGWSGLMIEPRPGAAEQCRRVYQHNPRIQVITAGCSDRYEVLPLAVSGLESTFARTGPHWDVVSARGPERIVEVPCYALSNLLFEQGVWQVDLLSIDAEGYEEKVLAGLDFDVHGPRMLVIELFLGVNAQGRPPRHADPGRSKRCAATILRHGYELVYRSAFNDIYVRNPRNLSGTPEET